MCFGPQPRHSYPDDLQAYRQARDNNVRRVEEWDDGIRGAGVALWGNPNDRWNYTDNAKYNQTWDSSNSVWRVKRWPEAERVRR